MTRVSIADWRGAVVAADARHPQALMLIGTLELTPAGIARWAVFAPYGPLAYFGLSDLFVLAMLTYDRATRGRFHPATL